MSDLFTDEILSPDRCTRSEGGEPHYDPLRDRDHSVIPGDELLVDVSAYLLPELGGDCLLWCEVTGLAAGSAAVYPYKVQIPGRGTGQYKASEVFGWRRPLKLHRMLIEIDYATEAVQAIIGTAP